MDISLSNQLGKGPQIVPDAGIVSAPVSEKAPAVSEKDRVIPKEDLQKQVDSLNKFVQTTNTHLKFTLHERLNEYYVQIVDNITDEVVREVPSKKILDLAAKIQEMIGILVDEKR
ncbi:flagellar protein FlaG [Brevibacillus choshinensis]|uniref:flagellar protein FlaG n=1 Tax=Brevibacillus choshinensis TaxID=54911 RepID=UPI002E20461F|nr:flagellar protein FlaG [Brevibacillus choshinensis]